MTPQIIGTKKNRGVRAAERFCRERRIAYQLVDIAVRPPGPAELERIAQAAGGFEALIDTDSAVYKKRKMAYLDFDAAEEIAGHPELLRQPIVRSDAGIAVEPDLATLRRLFGV